MPLFADIATAGPKITPKDSVHTQGCLFHRRITSITEEVVSFSLVNYCPKHIDFIDGMQVVEVNTCETRGEIIVSNNYNNNNKVHY